MQFNTPAQSKHETSCIETSSCILYHNDRVTLIDIPASIADAQEDSAASCTSTSPRPSLLSCPPIAAPFPSHEPKSESARARLRAKMASENDAVYADLITSSLDVIRHFYHGPWCLPRYCVPQPIDALPGKRKAGDISADTASSEDQDLLHQLSSGLSPTESYSYNWHDPTNIRRARIIDRQTRAWPKYLCNSSKVSRLLEITSPSIPEPIKFHVPPGAAFYLGDCSSSRPFHLAVRDIAQQLNAPRQFDIVVMDPPWPNASVKRTEKSGKSAYQVSPTIWDIRQLVFGLDVDVLLANEGVIAIWITNKPAVRDLVLGEDGFFESWGVQLEEEWLWIKTTHDGKPVSALDGLWRKPYEVLLLGRKRDQCRSDHHHVQDVNPADNPKVERRVVVGVPDLHSRKPCLKRLFDRFVVTPRSRQEDQHRTLEVFARYLVAGWWSWGNQVLKFNDEHCWTS